MNNEVKLTGNLTKDFEVKKGKEKGTIYTINTLAVNDTESVKGKEVKKTVFINFVLFGKVAESAAAVMKKGSFVKAFASLENVKGSKKNELTVKIHSLKPIVKKTTV